MWTNQPMLAYTMHIDKESKVQMKREREHTKAARKATEKMLVSEHPFFLLVVLDAFPAPPQQLEI
jgi:hypothetical protein